MNINGLMEAPDGPIDILKVLEPNAYAGVQELVEAGALPVDTFLRLDSIGDNVPDGSDVEHASLRWAMLRELDALGEAPESLSPQTRNLIFGEPPRAMLAWCADRDVKLLHTEYDRPYLVRDDLANVIQERRVDEGKTVTEVPDDRRWRLPEVVEYSQCMRIAHGLWSTMARRIMPEWLEPVTLDLFYRPHKHGTHIELGLDSQVMNRRIVGAMALKVTHIKDIYDESLREGVRGIGPVGKQDLRTLLAEEYPELY